MTSDASATASTLTIAHLGHHGDGLAPGPVVVPGTLPGEVVEGVISGDRIDAPRILTPSSDRVRAPCPHARTCGGCIVQHASDDLVSAWKRTMVLDALGNQGIKAEVGAPITSPPRSRRRAGFAGRRTKKGALIGFHGRRSHTLIEVPNCEVITDGLRAVLPALEALVIAGASRKGEIGFQVTETLNGPDVVATGGKPMDRGLHEELVQIGANSGFARLIWGGETVAQWNAPEVAMGTARVALPGGAFLQATRAGEAALLSAVDGIIGDAARIADLFCGCGTFALPLSARAGVLAVESQQAQIDALAAAWRRTPNLHQVDVQARDLFQRPLGVAEMKHLDGIVIDPPRAGAAAQMAELAKSTVARIASVSCNPATFARDAATLIAGGYRMGPVTVVDQFRWSPHVELVAGFWRD